MGKYNRTPHFSFSLEIHSDDKTISLDAERNNFVGVELVVTEKLDGSNACLREGQVFGRTHAVPANHLSFSMLKRISSHLLSQNRLEQDAWIFGENMQAVHSIDYGEIASPFFIFNVKRGDVWLSWTEVKKIAQRLFLPIVPVVFVGKFTTIERLKSFLIEEIKKPSMLNKNAHREGFVVRPYGAFYDKDFATKVAKFVRKGHVQNDEHWSKGWREARISKSFWQSFYSGSR